MPTCFSNDSCSPAAGPSRPSCPAVGEIPLTMVSKEVEEQVHSIRDSSSANSVKSGRHTELFGTLLLVQDRNYSLSQTWLAWYLSSNHVCHMGTCCPVATESIFHNWWPCHSLPAAEALWCNWGVVIAKVLVNTWTTAQEWPPNRDNLISTIVEKGRRGIESLG